MSSRKRPDVLALVRCLLLHGDVADAHRRHFRPDPLTTAWPLMAAPPLTIRTY